MNIYLLSQDINNDYDTYDSMVVSAKDEDEARKIHPDGRSGWKGWRGKLFSSWVETPSQVEVKYLGKAEGGKKGIILSSSNPG